MMDMITTSVTVKQFESPNEAPKYGEDWKLLRLENALIVKHGTVGDNPTVDLQLVDAEGNKYLVMATGGIVSMLGSAVKGAGGA